VTHRRRALAVILAAILLDTGLGLAYAAETPGLPWWHGCFCALANAVTVGGDVPPVNAAGYVVTALECALVVPLVAAAFSLLTSGLTAVHVAASEKRVKAHVEMRLREHLGEPAGRHQERGSRGLPPDALAQDSIDCTKAPRWCLTTTGATPNLNGLGTGLTWASLRVT
jgi:hypothetical protein